MRIYLAGSPAYHENYHMVGQEHPNHLTSYAYHKEIEKHWERVWGDMVRLHFVSWPSQEVQKKALKSEGPQNHLLSYEHRKEEKSFSEVWRSPLPNVIIDSGAFTAHETGRVIHAQEYGEWALAFKERWESKMNSLHFINLDVIGDQRKSVKNYERLKHMGLNPLPVVTFGAGKRDLKLAMEQSDYIALGGLVTPGKTRGRKKLLRSWLDPCFKVITDHYKETGKLIKVHLLGITTEWTVFRYPIYSSDSSSWTSSLRFGGGKSAGLKNVPKYKNGPPGAKEANIHVLRQAIRKLKRLEATATELWRRKGVIWDD